LWGINKLSCALLDAGGYFARGFAVNRSCSRSRIVVVVAVSHFLREQAFFLLSVLRLGGERKQLGFCGTLMLAFELLPGA
jgi:hypothetical protein